MEISVIIPVYNVEKELDKCIRSILIQTFHDFELILINDGSTDSSGAICDKYAKDDKRVIVIHKQNEGVSKARNIGINEAKGKYLMFIDSDDWIEEDTLGKLINTVHNTNHDLVMFSIIYDYYNEKENIEKSIIKGSKELISIKLSDFKDKFKDLFEECNFLSSCNKLFLSSIVKENNILYDEETLVYEDFNFNLKVFMKSKSICILPEVLYHYKIEIHNSGIAKRNKLDITKDINRVTGTLMEFLEYIQCDEETYKYMYEYMFVLYYHCFNKILEKNNGTVKEKRRVISKLNNDSNFRIVMDKHGNKITFYKFIYILMRFKMYNSTYFIMKLRTRVSK